MNQQQQSLSQNDSFEILPDKLSDDEKLEKDEMKRFTPNTHSGKSLKVKEVQQNLRKSKKLSQNNLEEAKLINMRRSSET